MNDFDRRKIATNAPCAYSYTTRKGQTMRAVPLVDCDMDCATCGWNPAEKERRLSAGLKKRKTGGRKLVFRRSA